MPDNWENTYGLDPLVDDSGDDFDNDGFTNLQEYQANTNPLDANSVPVTLDYLSELFDFSWSDTSLDYDHEYESLYGIILYCLADSNYIYENPLDGTIGVDSNGNSFIRTFAEEENPPIVYYMHFNDDGSFYSGWFFTPWVDASWGNDISKADDNSFNTVYAAEPSDLKDDDNFEVISYIDEFSPLCGTNNLKSYFFTYDTKNDDNGSAVSFAQWISYLADITSTYGRPIDTLTIFAHGDPGVVHMSQEFDLRNDEEANIINLKWNDQENKGILSKNSTILLFSCNVGEGEDGKTFVQNLANWTGATVFANSVKTGDLLEKGTENGTLIIRDWELDVIAIPDDYFSSPDNELHSIPVNSDIDKTVMLPGGVLIEIEKGDLAEDGVLKIRNVFDQYSSDDNISGAYEISLTTQITDGNSILISIPYNSDLINLNESELTVKFWDENSQQWSGEGIWDILINDNYVIFKTNHTTVFAVIKEAQTVPGDLDGDSVVDRTDLNIILSYRNQPASVCPECDLDGDGMITALDARKLVLLCTCPRCVCPPS